MMYRLTEVTSITRIHQDQDSGLRTIAQLQHRGAYSVEILIKSKKSQEDIYRKSTPDIGSLPNSSMP